MLQKVPLLALLFLGLLLCLSLHVEAFSEDVSAWERPYLVRRGHRRSLVVTEYGEISAAEISSGTKGPYHIQFITLEPSSLLLPVLLHADMVFYVHTGNGKLSWTDGREMKRMNLRRGDVYRLQAGSVFFVQSNLDSERQKMRIHAIFSNTDEDIYEPSIGAYSSVSDLVLGFDRKVLQEAFKVPEEVLEELTSATKPPAVVHAVTKDQKSVYWELEDRMLDFLIGNKHKKTKETKTFNILDAKPDFENCNGWSLTVDKHSLKSLSDSNIGIFMVNLTKGSMMGPHWNPMATEIAIVLHGRGMVRVICHSTANESECKNMRFKVKEGDVFAVPRFHPMAQISFNNDSFVFMGFSTSTKRNHPQFLTGKSSILQILDRGILAVSFNVTNTTMDQLLNAQEEALILDCTSCAEIEENKMKEEFEKEKQEEEARKREEQEARKREEEEARKREEEEEEARKREEEEREREEEEARKREEEERREHEEAERERQEEEEKQRREEEEEEARKREEEEREREEEEARKREEEERREQEEAERERQEEEEKQRREEEARKREEEERREQEEAERERQEEEEKQRREEEARKREEEEREREEEERREQEETERERQEEDEKQRREEEQQQEEARRREEKKKRQEKQRQREETPRREHEEARRQEEERQKRRWKEEERAKERERREGGGEQPEEQEVEARKEDQERKGDEGKGRRALRNPWKL
ncbi:vicilin-like seed storage protein At2g18540 [Populus nigra]|uniref:vicilin-like seed storage protein At2g18540 n=1 Tax=Populus nigra TaxID=3691 RepID=UPI002B2744CE|nr:vicilin-like seed storage protein At2g18540 [Populus nigra]